MKKKSLMRLAVLCFGIAAWLTMAQPAMADDKETLEKLWKDNYGNITLPEPAVYSVEMLAKAKPDECFYGIGHREISHLSIPTIWDIPSIQKTSHQSRSQPATTGAVIRR